MNDISILKLKPVFQEKIWGGRRLQRYFGQKLPTGPIGECWLISAHPNGDTLIDGGPLNGHPLSRVYQEYKHLFGNPKRLDFPLIIKIIDASEDLSVQVHPDDMHAHSIGQPYGKEEAWLILEPSLDNKVQLGHHADSKDHLKQLIDLARWDQLLKFYPLETNDLVPVKPGTLHAILKGTMILEIQQSSDTTYRVYDYDRVDDSGNKRPLHLKQAIDVIGIPDSSVAPIKITQTNNNQMKTLWAGNYFSINEWNITGQMAFKPEPTIFYLLTVLTGDGTINNVACHQGDAFIITTKATAIDIKGDLRIIVAIPSKEA